MCLSTWSPASAAVLGGCRRFETETSLAEAGYPRGPRKLELSPGLF